MFEWIPALKSYPHFDRLLPKQEILSLVLDPARVAKNSFFPFLEYSHSYKKFGRIPKERKIRYASRRDAYIFSYYRSLLLPIYEKKLVEYNIQNCPIAYRKIPSSEKSHTGKCNIHFAKEAFEEIARRKSCFVIALDISKFFESLDHQKIYDLWCWLLNVTELPPDHKAVFKAITNYRVVNRDKCYTVLGYKNDSFPSHKKQLCNLNIFRDKITPLIQKNDNPYGIPQGSPISDLLANLYLINFDKEIYALAEKFGGYYRRYSDDILFICPDEEATLQTVKAIINKHIESAGEKLLINNKKTTITKFYLLNNVLTFIPYQLNESDKKKHLEYLGFSFNGKKALIKSSTISSYYRNMVYGIRYEARNLAARFHGKTLKEIFALANFSKISQKYGKIRHFDPSCDYTEQNFFSYAKRASNIMGEMGISILDQLRNRHKKLKIMLKEEINKYFHLRSSPNRRIANLANKKKCNKS